MKAIRLRTEHLKEAMGVDFSRPELTWNCEGGIRQTAWRILARSGNETVWDSGKVAEAPCVRSILMLFPRVCALHGR